MDSNRLSQYRLTKGESMILAAMQSYLMKADIDREGNSRRGATKRAALRNFDRDAKKVIGALAAGEEPLGIDRLSRLTRDDWQEVFPAIVKGTTSSNVLSRAAPLLATHVTDKPRGLLILIELYAFNPWPEKNKWNQSARNQALKDLTNAMPALTEADYRNVESEFKRAMRRLARKSVSWGKVSGVAALGIVLGIVTMGLAAPAIGAMIGGAMGLSGAAAVSAGLAFLGGGAVAAGGAGMAGGTALLVGLGGAAGGVAFAGGGHVAGLTGKAAVAEAIKLDVLIKVVMLDAEGDEAQAKATVLALQERLETVEANLADLAAKLRASNNQQKETQKRLKESQRDNMMLRIQLEEMIKDYG